MRYSHLWALLAALASTATSRSTNCGESGDDAQQNNSINFENFKQWIQETESTRFEDEARLHRGDNLPDLQTLTAMANDVFSGSIPQYIQNNNYSNHGLFEGNFSMSAFSSTDQRGVSFLSFHSEGDRGTVSLLDFYNVSGTIGNTSFISGAGFHTYAHYSKDDTFLEFEVSTLGAILYRSPMGNFVQYGNYIGVSMGNATQTTSEMAEASIDTLGFLNSYQYTSRNVLYQNGQYFHDNTQQHVNSFSLTGGTNSTMNSYLLNDPDTNAVQMFMNTTMQNHDKEDFMTANYTGSYSPQVDFSSPLSDGLITSFISLSRNGAEVFLG